RFAEALPLAQRALEGARKAFGRGGEDEEYALDAISAALEGLGRYDDAIETAELAVTLREREPGTNDLAAAREALGMALVKSGRDRKRGVAVLEVARQ